MKRLSLSGTMILVVLAAVVLALFARLGGEASFYVVGPLLGAIIASLIHRRDESALITGGLIGGLCGGIFAVLVLKRGYIFSDVAMITGGLFLMTLGVHLVAGLVIGTLLYLAVRRTAPRQV